MDTWRKSSFSGSNGGDCVEAADFEHGIKVRDTKDNGLGPVLTFGASAWETFLATIR
jgi:hypothetical protein